MEERIYVFMVFYKKGKWKVKELNNEDELEDFLINYLNKHKKYCRLSDLRTCSLFELINECIKVGMIVSDERTGYSIVKVVRGNEFEDSSSSNEEECEDDFVESVLSSDEQESEEEEEGCEERGEGEIVCEERGEGEIVCGEKEEKNEEGEDEEEEKDKKNEGSDYTSHSKHIPVPKSTCLSQTFPLQILQT